MFLDVSTFITRVVFSIYPQRNNFFRRSSIHHHQQEARQIGRGEWCRTSTHPCLRPSARECSGELLFGSATAGTGGGRGDGCCGGGGDARGRRACDTEETQGVYGGVPVRGRLLGEEAVGSRLLWRDFLRCRIRDMGRGRGFLVFCIP